MFFPKERRSLLRKTALKKYARKKVTKVQRDVDCWGNVWGDKPTVEGLQMLRDFSGFCGTLLDCPRLNTLKVSLRGLLACSGRRPRLRRRSKT